MKHLLLVLVMFSALNAAAADTAPRHRHQHVDAALVQSADSANSVHMLTPTLLLTRLMTTSRKKP